MHLFILCTRVALITAVQFSIFFFTISLQIEEAYKLHIILFQIFWDFSLFFSTTWPQSDRPHFICYTWNYVGLDYAAQSSWPKENQDVCPGWSRCHDSVTGTPRHVHQDTQVSLCTFRGRLWLQKYSPEGVVQGWCLSWNAFFSFSLDTMSLAGPLKCYYDQIFTSWFFRCIA